MYSTKEVNSCVPSPAPVPFTAGPPTSCQKPQRRGGRGEGVPPATRVLWLQGRGGGAPRRGAGVQGTALSPPALGWGWGVWAPAEVMGVAPPAPLHLHAAGPPAPHTVQSVGFARPRPHESHFPHPPHPCGVPVPKPKPPLRPPPRIPFYPLSCVPPRLPTPQPPPSHTCRAARRPSKNRSMTAATTARPRPPIRATAQHGLEGGASAPRGLSGEAERPRARGTPGAPQAGCWEGWAQAQGVGRRRCP